MGFRDGRIFGIEKDFGKVGCGGDSGMNSRSWGFLGWKLLVGRNTRHHFDEVKIWPLQMPPTWLFSLLRKWHPETELEAQFWTSNLKVNFEPYPCRTQAWEKVQHWPPTRVQDCQPRTKFGTLKNFELPNLVQVSHSRTKLGPSELNFELQLGRVAPPDR